jgi:hypothetical protein
MATVSMRKYLRIQRLPSSRMRHLLSNIVGSLFLCGLSFPDFRSHTTWAAAVLVDEACVPALCEWRVARLAPRTQLLFNGFAEFDVALGHVRCDVAVQEERQDPVDPSGTLFGFAPLGALGSGALSSSVDRLPGGFGRKNRNEAIAIDVDESSRERRGRAWNSSQVIAVQLRSFSACGLVKMTFSQAHSGAPPILVDEFDAGRSHRIQNLFDCPSAAAYGAIVCL